MKLFEIYGIDILFNIIYFFFMIRIISMIFIFRKLKDFELFCINYFVMSYLLLASLIVIIIYFNI